MSGGSGAWRAGAAVVATLTFDVDAETPILAQGGRYARHLTTMSHQAFGPDVAVPRILDLLDQLDVPATFFVPGWVAERRPHLAPSIVDRGHEVAHHSYSHRSATDLTPQEQRDDFERALEVFDRQGIEIAGHRAALWQTTTTTMELLAEHRLAYDSSMMGDDRPYLLRLGDDAVVELPVHWSLDDWEQYAFLPEPHVGSVIEAPSKVSTCGAASSTRCASTGACSTCASTRSSPAGRAASRSYGVWSSVPASTATSRSSGAATSPPGSPRWVACVRSGSPRPRSTPRPIPAEPR